MKLAGKGALITGASEGFGKAVARAFLENGASVVICARRRGPLLKAYDELSRFAGKGQKLMACPADVSKPSQAECLVRCALKKMGRVDVLVNNAGVYGPKGPLEKTDAREWAKALEINLLGAVHLCRKLLPHFKKRGRGKIINLSGGGATNPLPNLSAYAASKAALVRFSETLAEETRGSDIDVNSVAPGALNTRLLDEILEAGPEKVGRAFYERSRKQKEEGGVPLEKGAALCVFLASSESDGITGKLISAAWDPWESLPRHLEDVRGTDIYTLRRIVPKDRGLSWGDRPAP